MVWRLHRRGFGATSALDGSFIFDLSISFPEKLLLTLLRISTRTDGLRSWSTRNRQLCLDHDWSTLIAIVLFPTSTKTRSSILPTNDEPVIPKDNDSPSKSDEESFSDARSSTSSEDHHDKAGNRKKKAKTKKSKENIVNFFDEDSDDDLDNIIGI